MQGHGLSKARCMCKQESDSQVGEDKVLSGKPHSKNLYTLGKPKC